MMKTVLIGDIHGSAAQFYDVLTKTNLSVAEDKLILLGDLIDRGNSSYAVIQQVIRLKRDMQDRLIILRGSHEMLFLNHTSKKDALLWRMVGRGSTVRSFRKNGDDLFRYTEWVRQNTIPYYEDVLFQCAHAGIRQEPISANEEDTLMMDHFLTKQNRYKGKLTITGHIHLKQPSYFDGTGGKAEDLPYGEWLDLPKQGVICLDTGCGSRGRTLTGMILEGTSYFLVSAP